MSAMYSIHKTMHPPTGIELSLYCSLMGQGDQQLVVAGSNMLKVFRLVPDPEALNSTEEGRTMVVGGSSARGRRGRICMLDPV